MPSLPNRGGDAMRRRLALLLWWAGYCLTALLFVALAILA